MDSSTVSDVTTKLKSFWEDLEDGSVSTEPLTSEGSESQQVWKFEFGTELDDPVFDDWDKSLGMEASTVTSIASLDTGHDTHRTPGKTLNIYLGRMESTCVEVLLLLLVMWCGVQAGVYCQVKRRSSCVLSTHGILSSWKMARLER